MTAENGHKHTPYAFLLLTLHLYYSYPMDIKELIRIYSSTAQVNALKKLFKEKDTGHIFLENTHGSAPAVIFASSLTGEDNVLFILNDLEEAGYFYHDLAQISGEDNVLFFPSSYKRSVKYGNIDPANEVLRTEALTALQKKKKGLAIVSYTEAVMEKVISRQQLSANTITIKKGNAYDSNSLIGDFLKHGFERTDYVYEPGQFAVRGSILDIFSFSAEDPYRIDFFDDEVESIRTFDINTQLSKKQLDSISIIPQFLSDNDGYVSLLEFMGDNTLIALKDFLYVAENIQTAYEEANSQAAMEKRAANESKEVFMDRKLMNKAEFISLTLSHRRIEFGNRPTGTPDATIRFGMSEQPLFHKNFDLASAAISAYTKKGYDIYICSDSYKQIERIKTIFEDRNENITFTPIDKTLHEGFIDNDAKICCFTDHQIFDRFHKYNLKSDKARAGKMALTLKDLNMFHPGDYVVHTDHGIGKFAGLVRIPSGNSTQEVIKLIYQNEDVVFVSIHSLHKISKYKGKDGEQPRLNKLGTGAWEKLKERTKTKIKDIARDLIKLYSERKKEKGFCFSPDSFMQHELEASFIYEDTPDQLKATQDVKHDMERDTPMDRLICGDVGFGKTEVAIRAAFKAVADNKQVAVLVPTTVLAYQHYQTFKSRLKDFPCTVEYLSRARKGKEAKKILNGIADGSVNIIIGTHRLTGKDIHFKDLGLLIIDEEQKFGVSVKEKLRQMKVNVDTLTMTATPIPRTLQFSLMGARDLSVINTPPPNRYPVQTEIHTFDEGIIKDAIEFEMSRNGQVFFVNNRISNLYELKSLVERLIPDVKVCVGHGQMNPEELEKTIMAFINYDYDVMISTAIIESGVDIPNVNTIIINDAQNFGLSDLHQLRGRVGRSNKKAFCYLISPPLNVLTQEAKRRLQAIENFSDLGSGIHIAMQDLDIRGAGNLLGAEQSGFIADLGYETYQKVLAEAVHELKTDEFADLYAEENKANEKIAGDNFVDECTIESDLELLLPATYIPNSSERMLLYRELDNIKTDRETEEFKKRLVDRFGEIPSEALELIGVIKVRETAKKLGIEKVVLKSGNMSLYFVNRFDSPYYQSEAFGKVIAYLQNNPKRCNLKEVNNKRYMTISGVKDIETAKTVLNEMTDTAPAN